MVDWSDPLRYDSNDEKDLKKSAIFLECLFGQPPFIFSTVDELIEEIKSPVPIEVRDQFGNFFLKYFLLIPRFHMRLEFHLTVAISWKVYCNVIPVDALVSEISFNIHSY